MTTLTAETEARLLALMRPADDVAQVAVNWGLLQIIADQPDGARHIAALAFILRETLYAGISGHFCLGASLDSGAQCGSVVHDGCARTAAPAGGEAHDGS